MIKNYISNYKYENNIFINKNDNISNLYYDLLIYLENNDINNNIYDLYVFLYKFKYNDNGFYSPYLDMSLNISNETIIENINDIEDIQKIEKTYYNTLYDYFLESLIDKERILQLTKEYNTLYNQLNDIYINLDIQKSKNLNNILNFIDKMYLVNIFFDNFNYNLSLQDNINNIKQYKYPKYNKLFKSLLSEFEYNNIIELFLINNIDYNTFIKFSEIKDFNFPTLNEKNSIIYKIIDSINIKDRFLFIKILGLLNNRDILTNFLITYNNSPYYNKNEDDIPIFIIEYYTPKIKYFNFLENKIYSKDIRLDYLLQKLNLYNQELKQYYNLKYHIDSIEEKLLEKLIDFTSIFGDYEDNIITLYQSLLYNINNNIKLNKLKYINSNKDKNIFGILLNLKYKQFNINELNDKVNNFNNNIIDEFDRALKKDYDNLLNEFQEKNEIKLTDLIDKKINKIYSLLIDEIKKLNIPECNNIIDSNKTTIEKMEELNPIILDNDFINKYNINLNYPYLCNKVNENNEDIKLNNLIEIKFNDNLPNVLPNVYNEYNDMIGMAKNFSIVLPDNKFKELENKFNILDNEDIINYIKVKNNNMSIKRFFESLKDKYQDIFDNITINDIIDIINNNYNYNKNLIKIINETPNLENNFNIDFNNIIKYNEDELNNKQEKMEKLNTIIQKGLSFPTFDNIPDEFKENYYSKLLDNILFFMCSGFSFDFNFNLSINIPELNLFPNLLKSIKDKIQGFFDKLNKFSCMLISLIKDIYNLKLFLDNIIDIGKAMLTEIKELLSKYLQDFMTQVYSLVGDLSNYILNIYFLPKITIENIKMLLLTIQDSFILLYEDVKKQIEDNIKIAYTELKNIYNITKLVADNFITDLANNLSVLWDSLITEFSNNIYEIIRNNLNKCKGHMFNLDFDDLELKLPELKLDLPVLNICNL